MKFEHIRPYGRDTYSYYVSGIYKIVTYGPGEYHAYYMPEHFNNWGDHVSTPPDKGARSGEPCWRTRRAAERACRAHAREYKPSARIQARALDIIADYRTQAARYAERAA